MQMHLGQAKAVLPAWHYFSSLLDDVATAPDSRWPSSITEDIDKSGDIVVEPGPSADLVWEVVHSRGCTLEEDACGVEARRFYLIGSLDGLPTTDGVDSRRVSSLIDFESLERPLSIEFPSFNLNLRVEEYVQESTSSILY